MARTALLYALHTNGGRAGGKGERAGGRERGRGEAGRVYMEHYAILAEN